ncbi:SLAP domain-containing protein [Lactobacillus crispatus]|uniref:SLAP domain-containing protein n=1 Tax=Lactobacillus crispatus TaxID=47770 RepID=UPI0021BD79A8|nr:SLAP domain-containing protein [Lactobacillus crispatus]MCZ3600146.1 SLAP domain-containing protein [Lactobacillus crispatus]MCZ3641491.1 SLAP domain-containing protein [Lactobacillus crispatus]MCZ3643894.1 SLAP domain-containing protein [Lactobacillus crispatus]MCZ3646416.1 SLAP domain-containing protein [Lactobacillus crispatus]MCZ3648739.1 SLAP domain-containing protein [Lactobacillus crispatus]
MRKQNFKKVVASAVLTIGLISPMAMTNQSSNFLLGTTNTVQAATRKIKLTHNAYIYNYRGHRVGRRVLHKHATHIYFSVKKIHGKKYYRIGHNRYVKAGNAKVVKKHSKKIIKETTSAVSKSNTSVNPTSTNTNSLGSPIFKVHVFAGGNDVYKSSSDNSWFGAKDFKDGIYNVYASKNGKYEIGQNLWISEDAGEKVSDSQQANSKISGLNTAHISNSEASKTKNTNNYKPNEQNIARIFVRMVNKARAQKGIAPLSIDNSLMSMAHTRSIHDGNTLVATGHEDYHYGVSDNVAEVASGLNVQSNDTAVAKQAFDGFMYHDQDCNNEHRDILLQSDLTKIGVGVTYPRGNDSQYFGSLVADMQ